ncbi:MAG TPA: peroxidase-related enzyme [Nonomuraea sp.]|nr:peroxidase-related enzyme [Nonomuraea sp.]
MAHIELGNDEPGILGLLRYRPETGKALFELADVLLRGDNTLSRGERELIASYVSTRNGCGFCALSHGAFAAAQLPGGDDVVAQACAAPDTAPIPDKLRALLGLAEAVRRGGDAVTPEDVAAARAAGATDIEIHDTVLIAAAFCMFNRYVDGIGTSAPDDPAVYAQIAPAIVAHGYQL